MARRIEHPLLEYRIGNFAVGIHSHTMHGLVVHRLRNHPASHIPEPVVLEHKLHPALLTDLRAKLLLSEPGRELDGALGPAANGVDEFLGAFKVGSAAHLNQRLRIVQIQFRCPHNGEAAVGPAGVGHEVVVLVEIFSREVVRADD